MKRSTLKPKPPMTSATAAAALDKACADVMSATSTKARSQALSRVVNLAQHNAMMGLARVFEITAEVAPRAFYPMEVAKIAMVMASMVAPGKRTR